MRLAVFDLDFTIWDAGGTWCDCLRPPFRYGRGSVFDAAGSEVKVYADIPWALEALEHRGISLGLASRTERPAWARQILDLLGLRNRFTHEEIYPSSKVHHFRALREASGIDYCDMVFFDDERRNIVEVGELGVRCVWVQNGFRKELLESELRGV